MTDNAISTVLYALGMKLHLAEAVVLHADGYTCWDKWLFIRHYDIFHMNDKEKRKFWGLS